ncbi:MAG: hypothetical protein RQ783_07325 [Gammaproteobacteria bacterium]|nr:hypothetical protein [Gammaproteobacteria bacterium]
MASNKTDKANAQSIARYCQHLDGHGRANESLYIPKEADFERLQFLVRRLDQMNKMRS